MNLTVYVSKKGTRVVRAMELYQALDLPAAQYPRQIKRWINDHYEFSDGIRKPVRMQDYAKRPLRDQVVDDYFLSVEMGKMIALRSSSKHKLKFAQYLSTFEDQAGRPEQFTRTQIAAMIDLAKAMGLLSCQLAAEQKHLEVYESRNGGSPANWWKYRAELLGYSTEDLRKKMRIQGKSAQGKSQRELLLAIDKYEMIRTGVIDLLMAAGKSESYAKHLGDLAKLFAEEMQVSIYNDQKAESLSLAPTVNPRLVEKIRSHQPVQAYQLWQSSVPGVMDRAS
jgi:phage anti-repressor protein